jgi:hypothetical protein
MAIDPESETGQRLFATLPIPVDPTELTEVAGKLIIDKMYSGTTREEAVTQLINTGARYSQNNVVAIDLSRLFTAHPEIKEAVDKLTTEKDWTPGQAIGRLVLDGALSRTTSSPKYTPQKPLNFSDIVDALNNNGPSTGYTPHAKFPKV